MGFGRRLWREIVTGGHGDLVEADETFNMAELQSRLDDVDTAIDTGRQGAHARLVGYLAKGGYRVKSEIDAICLARTLLKEKHGSKH